MFNLIKAAATPVTAVCNVIDELYTSEEEKLTRQEVLTRVNQTPHLAQAEINKIEAQHRSLFVAGWRPFIGWVCGINLAYLVCVRDWLVFISVVTGVDVPIPPAVGMDMTPELVIALLGLGGLRTFEKVQGRVK